MENSIDDKINKILDLIAKSRNIDANFDGAIYSFKYQKSIKSPADSERAPSISIFGAASIQRYNALYREIWKDVRKDAKMSFAFFRQETQNLIFERSFNRKSLDKFMKSKSETRYVVIKKLYGLKLRSEAYEINDFIFVRKNSLRAFLNAKYQECEYSEQIATNAGELERDANEFVFVVMNIEALDQDFANSYADATINKMENAIKFMFGLRNYTCHIGIAPHNSFVSNYLCFSKNSLNMGNAIHKNFNHVFLDDPYFVDLKLGFNRLWDVLQNDFVGKSTSLEKNIIGALLWIGKTFSEESSELIYVEIANAFECLFLYTSKGSIINASIASSLAESYAFVNSDEYSERIRLEKEFKDFYAIRSSIVHSFSIDDDAFNYERCFSMIWMTIINLLTKEEFSKCSSKEEVRNIVQRKKYS